MIPKLVHCHRSLPLTPRFLNEAEDFEQWQKRQNRDVCKSLRRYAQLGLKNARASLSSFLKALFEVNL